MTTLWDKQSHVYSSFENVHVYRRLNAINIRRHICTVDIHYLEEIRDKLSDWNGKQRHVWTVTCRRSFELSEICFLWVQVWIQVLYFFFWFVVYFQNQPHFTILQLKVKMIWFFGWIFIYENILWYLLYKEWMSLTISPEHYLPRLVLKHFLHVHGIILSIVHVKVILRRIQNCCDYSWLFIKLLRYYKCPDWLKKKLLITAPLNT